MFHQLFLCWILEVGLFIPNWPFLNKIVLLQMAFIGSTVHPAFYSIGKSWYLMMYQRVAVSNFSWFSKMQILLHPCYEWYTAWSFPAEKRFVPRIFFFRRWLQKTSVELVTFLPSASVQVATPFKAFYAMSPNKTNWSNMNCCSNSLISWGENLHITFYILYHKQ